jgi:integrase
VADLTRRLEQWLGVRGGACRGARQQRRNAVGQRTIELLRTHAPDIAALKPGATMTPAEERALRDAARVDSHATEVHNAIAHVLDKGRLAGLWSHAWPIQRATPHANSRLSREGIARVAQASQLIDTLLHALPALAAETDPRVTAGALLVASALLGGVLHEDWLGQLLEPARPLQCVDGLAWIDLAMGRPEARWANVRRRFPGEIERFLHQRYTASLAERGADPPLPREALRALGNWLNHPVPAPPNLVKQADAYLATRVPAFMHEYLRAPPLAPSLAPPAWQRLLTGRPLPMGMPPNGPVDDASSAHDPRRGLAPPVPVSVPASRDGEALLKAVRRLKGCLRRTDPKQPKLRRDVLRRRLQHWHGHDGALGGWVAWLGAWVQDHCLRPARDGGEENRRIATTLRYLDGFAVRLVLALRELPPEAAAEDPDAVAQALRRLRDELQGLNSAGVAAAGLRAFLGFVATQGGPVVTLDSEWSALVQPGQVRATIVTVDDFSRLLDWLGRRFPPGSYPWQRARLMATLAFRLGLRWEEARDLRFRDILLGAERDGRGRAIHGEAWIRPTAHSNRKSEQAVRKLPLEAFLVRQEMALLQWLLTHADGPRRPDDYLFADPGDPSRPPATADTRDAIQEGLRWATGDSGMVFHDLRHGAANYALLRLMVPACPMLPARVPGLAKLEAAVGLGEPLANRLTGRGPRDPARLYALSELMGHVDPGVTLRHYVHLLDLVVGLTLSSQVRVPAAAEAALAGVKRASIRRRRHRDRVRERMR